MEGGRRSVIRETEFEEQLLELLVNPEEADDYIAAAEYVLSSNPHLGSLAAKGPPEIWFLLLPPVRDRAVRLFYSFDKEHVYFMHVVAYD